MEPQSTYHTASFNARADLLGCMATCCTLLPRVLGPAGWGTPHRSPWGPDDCSTHRAAHIVPRAGGDHVARVHGVAALGIHPPGQGGHR